MYPDSGESFCRKTHRERKGAKPHEKYERDSKRDEGLLLFLRILRSKPESMTPEPKFMLVLQQSGQYPLVYFSVLLLFSRLFSLGDLRGTTAPSRQ